MATESQQKRKQRQKQKRSRERNEAKLLGEFDHCKSICDASPEAIKLATELMQKSNAGDQVAFAKVRHLVKKLPQEVRVVHGPAASSDACYASLMNGNSLVNGELQMLATRQLRQDLLKLGDSPIERLLVDEIIDSHLDLQCARNFHQTHLKQESNLDFSDQRLAACQRRFLAATEALERLRNARKRSQPKGTKASLQLTDVQIANRLQALMN